MIAKRIFAVLVTAVMLAALCTAALALEDIVFTVQPKGGETTNGKDFTFSWETNIECRYLLQSRDDDTYDWGNMDWITSPFSIDMSDYTAQYRIMAVREEDGAEFFSDVFTIVWKPADDLTEVEIQGVTFGELPLGYSDIPKLPIVFKNVGKYELQNPRVEMGYGGDEYFEIIERDTPRNTPPGGVDEVTWSISPKKGLGTGDYHELFYLFADNLAEPASAAADISIIESEVEITYSIEANDVDFGTLPQGYEQPENIDLVVRANGTGNLTKVHIKIGDDGQSFFALRQNNAQLDRLAAGTGSGTNWYVVLNRGLEPGEYSAEVEVYAAEISEPFKVKISATVTANAESSASDPNALSDAGENVGASGDGSAAGSSGALPADGGEASGGFPWAAVVIPLAVIALGAVVFVIVKRKKRDEGSR